MDKQQVNHLAEARFKLARAWHLKGKVESAIARYQETINLFPNYIPAYLSLGSLLLVEGQLEEAIALYNRGIDVNPNEAEFHKNIVNAIVKHEGIDAAFQYYQLSRVDDKDLNVKPADILCCSVVRNEALRLPYFLSYYREKGINKFFIVDNGSTDETLSYLLEQNEVYIWQSNLSFNRANFGSAWFEVLLRKYGLDRWCLMVDADEIFYYGNCENKSIPQLCQELDTQNKKAFNAVLLDMYSDKAIEDTHYHKGENFLEVCPYFDKNFYHTKLENAGRYRNQTVYVGGVRERVCGEKGDYYLSKVPLIKYDLDRVLTGGQHSTNCPEEKIAVESGCLLHFKYFSSFHSYVEDQVTRGEHYNKGMQYVEYAKAIKQDPALTLYDKDLSVKLLSSQQLVELGIIETEESQSFPDAVPISLQERDNRFGHILFYTDCPEMYGAGQWNHSLMCGLVASGYKVTEAQSKASHRLVKQRNQLGIQHLWLEDDDIYHPTKPARAFVNTDEAQKIFELAKPDLIIFSDGCPVSNLAAQQVAMGMGIPYIKIVHCISSDWAKQFSSHLHKLPDIYENAKAVISVSHENLGLLRQLFELPDNKGKVIYNGRPARYFTEPNLEVRDRLRQSLGIPRDAIVCFTAARLDIVKGYQYQLSAMQQLKESEIFSQLYFVWAGSGMLLNRLKTVAGELGVTEQVKLIGDRSDIPDLLDAADIFILPSQFEGMPLAIMEAMAKGKPVIATAVSGIPEELGDTGKLLSDPKINPQFTIRELATTIQTWAFDSALRSAIGKTGKQRAEKMFREERMLQEYVAIVEHLLPSADY